ncbi:MAG TPA: penicillin acylase family protein, partial [Acidimicrobiales bacterium]
MRHPATGRARRAAAVVLAVASLAAPAAACTGDGGGGADDAGEVVGEGDTYEATIRRTDGGIPHITGDSLADVAFGQGWASGEDRACDLADQVLKVTSQRARWLGPGEDDANVDSDVAWLAIGLAERAASEWDEASDEAVELITAYTDGWNGQLDHVGADGLAGW